MERSRYFGYSKDLYHFDHFMGEQFIYLQGCPGFALDPFSQVAIESPASCFSVAERAA